MYIFLFSWQVRIFLIYIITQKRISLIEMFIPCIFLLNCPWRDDDSPILLQDGRINYDEFAAMMRKGDPDLVTNRRRKWTSWACVVLQFFIWAVFTSYKKLLCFVLWLLAEMGLCEPSGSGISMVQCVCVCVCPKYRDSFLR